MSGWGSYDLYVSGGGDHVLTGKITGMNWFYGSGEADRVTGTDGATLLALEMTDGAA